MPAFPVVAAAILFIGGIAIGAALRRRAGRHWAVVLPLVALTLVPWFLHHHDVLRFTAAALDEQRPEGAVERLRWVWGAGLAAVGAVSTAILVAARWFPVVAAAIPGGAFLITWYLTFPLAHAAVPDGFIGMDNMATIWLAILSVGASGLLLGYCVTWPGRADSA